MAFTMTHIFAAEKALAFLPFIKDFPTYILGTIAPDAVHANPDFTTGKKERSHLFPPGPRWGHICDRESAESWLESIKKYYFVNSGSCNHDFLTGYIVHLLVDVYCSIYFYAPFVKSITGDYQKTIETYKNECYGVNFHLLSLYSEKKDLQSILRAGEAVTLEGVIDKEDIEHRISQLFDLEFQNRDISKISEYSICTIEAMEQLIQGAADFVKEKFSSMLYELAMKYIYGDDVPEDNELAAELLTQAHGMGHVEAANGGWGEGMEPVGRFFNQGIYVEQNRRQAEYWLHKAMESSDPEAADEAGKKMNAENISNGIQEQK